MINETIILAMQLFITIFFIFVAIMVLSPFIISVINGLLTAHDIKSTRKQKKW